MPHTELPSRASIASRLDALPFTRPHLRVLTGSGLGWALDAMDVGLISFIIAVLAQQWQLSPAETGWIASIGFVGMAIGASVGGLLADRLGRRQVFAITLLIYGIATGASALAGGVALLLVLRFFVGLGLGAELPVASTYVSEFAPAAIRGRLIVILEAFWAVGWTASALIGYFVIPASKTAGGGPSPSVRYPPRTPSWCAGAFRSRRAGSPREGGSPRPNGSCRPSRRPLTCSARRPRAPSLRRSPSPRMPHSAWGRCGRPSSVHARHASGSSGSA